MTYVRLWAFCSLAVLQGFCYMEKHMKYYLKNLTIYEENNVFSGSIAVDNGVIVSLAHDFFANDFEIIDCRGYCALPGFADAHVHLREPGFSYKETIRTGTLAAAHGGFTAVCPMPNLIPVPDCTENLMRELEIINRDAVIGVYPYGAITKGQNGAALADFEAMEKHVPAFSDDGKGVQSASVMEKAMRSAKKLDKIIAAHCEDKALIAGRICIHDGAYAKSKGVSGVPSESEHKPIARDIDLCRKTGSKYHVCHVSCKESIELIRSAKAAGVDITCETAPHYLVFCDEDLKDSGAFKMNPPIRERTDKDALIQAVCDGTVDMISTDHAPHSREEKSKGILNSANGIVGLETSFPVMYTHFVEAGIITVQKLLALMCYNPRRRFSLPIPKIAVGETADFTIFDLNTPYKVDSREFLSMGKSTPFENMTLYGRCKLTAYGDAIPWREI